MPNYCDNYLRIDGPVDAVKNLIDFVKSNENKFDFNKIVPMPDYIYQGPVGSAEKALYTRQTPQQMSYQYRRTYGFSSSSAPLQKQKNGNPIIEFFLKTMGFPLCC